MGNTRKKVISELAGKSAILEIAQKYVPEIAKTDKRLAQCLEKIKKMKKNGYQFEDTTASIELIIAETLKTYKSIVYKSYS